MSLYPGSTTELPECSLRLPPGPGAPIGFSGTVDAFLEGLRDGSLDLRTVPWREVVEQYLAFLRAWPEDTLGAAREFVLLAATLMALKAQRLAPPGEDRQPEGTSATLLATHQEIVRQIAEGERRRRAAAEEITPAGPELPPDVGRRSLLDLMLLLRDVESSRRAPLVVAETGLSVREAREWIRRSLPDHAALAADSFLTQCETGRDQAAVFLALLELGRNGLVDCHQTEAFAPLWLCVTPEDESAGPRPR
jgi:segregation and condensation protein A